VPVVDKSIGPNAGVAREIVLLFTDDVPISQTGLLVDAALPAFGFYVEKIECFVEALTAAATFQVLIGSTALCAATAPTADQLDQVTITATTAQRKGSSTDAINLQVTTDGSGLMTGLKVKVHIRPFPMGGEF